MRPQLAPVTRSAAPRHLTGAASLVARLREAIRTAWSVYTSQGLSVPPSISALAALIEDQDFANLRGQVPVQWGYLLEFHKLSGKSPAGIGLVRRLFDQIQNEVVAYHCGITGMHDAPNAPQESAATPAE